VEGKQPSSREDVGKEMLGWTSRQRCKGISKSLQIAGIGVEVRVNLPGGIRVGMTHQTPSEAPSVRAE